MSIEAMNKVENMAQGKSKLLKSNKMAYLMASLLGGAFIGFGTLLIFSIGGQIGAGPYTKLIMGVSFGIALSLVVMAGAELFTGNVFVMISALFKGKVTVGEMLKILIASYIGNWLGSIILALIFIGTGLTEGSVGEFIATAAETKMYLGVWDLFFRAILCNALVCLAVWCSIRMKSEAGKLIIIFWCLFAFITSGYEHSIANMTLLTVSLSESFNLAGYFYNIGIVSLGNIVGGLLIVALPYYFITKTKGEK